MGDLVLSLACVPTDRTRQLLDGSVRVPGLTFRPIPGEPEEIFRRALREDAFDVCEMSMSSHIIVTGRSAAKYTGIPVFPSRAFRHSAIYIRTDRGLAHPRDLKGRLIGIPEYQMTAALWVRGMLRDLYGVGAGDARWRLGGLESPGAAERIGLDLPDHIDAAPIGPNDTLNDLLVAGEIDALISPRLPSCMGQEGVPVGRLFPDYREAEIAYHRTTGFFPIMHCLAVREPLAQDHPELPAALFKAFSEARDRAIMALSMINVTRVTLPWAAQALDDTRAVMGDDFWSYGFARNRDELEAMTRYAQEDGLTRDKVRPEELFHESTLGLIA